LHGGCICMRSAPGAGTTVTVTLPPDRVCPNATELRPRMQMRG
jgi:signal transduction histidine kinase